MRLHVIAATLILQVAAQQTGEPTRKSSLAGVVLRAGTNDPVPRAQLTLLPDLPDSPAAPASSLPEPVSADTEGKFEFKDVPPGSYRLAGARNGYVRQEFGQKAVGGRGTAIEVMVGQTVKDIVFHLVPGGNVSGRVQDATGEVLTGVTVRLMRVTYSNDGQKVLTSVGQARTDDHGDYRLYWVTPGRYYLTVDRDDPSVAAIIGERSIRSQNELMEEIHFTTYYPGTFDSSEAALIDVQPAAELIAMNVIVPRPPLYRVSGKLIDATTGKPPEGRGSIGLRRPGLGATTGISSTYNPADGTFELSNVTPAVYLLYASARVARGSAPATTIARGLSASAISAQITTQVSILNGDVQGLILPLSPTFPISVQVRIKDQDLKARQNARVRIRLAPAAANDGTVVDRQAQLAMALGASVPVHVTDADIDGLALTITAGVAVQGKLIVEGQPISAVPNVAQLRLNVSSVRPRNSFGVPSSSAIGADGVFQVSGMRDSSEYRAQLSANVPGFYVKSIKYGEAEIAGRAFKVSAVSPGSFEIVLKAGTTTVSGTVTDANSKPAPGVAAVLIPNQRERTDLVRNVNSDQNGNFTMTDVAPVEYKVFSWEAADNNAWFDPDFLDQYEQLGKPVSVKASLNSGVDVKLIPAK